METRSISRNEENAHGDNAEHVRLPLSTCTVPETNLETGVKSTLPILQSILSYSKKLLLVKSTQKRKDCNMGVWMSIPFRKARRTMTKFLPEKKLR